MSESRYVYVVFDIDVNGDRTNVLAVDGNSEAVAHELANRIGGGVDCLVLVRGIESTTDE